MTLSEKLNIQTRIFLRRVFYKLSKNSGLYKKVDLQLEEILKKKFRPGSDFYFIQVGANDGVSHDWLYDFVKDRKSYGVVIEPLPDFFALLKKNYSYTPRVKPLHCAVHASANDISLFRVDAAALKDLPDWAGGIASVSLDHFKNSPVDPKHIVEEKVPARHLMEIIKNDYKHQRIDLLQIDVEGYDWEVLKMLDFHQYKPAFVKMEYVNLSEADIAATRALLARNGYMMYYEGIDLIALHAGA